MKNIVRKTLWYIFVGAVIISLCVIMLLLSALIPQNLLSENLLLSSYELGREGDYFYSFDYKPDSMRDNYTDSIILMESGAMNSEDLRSVLRNPLYIGYNEDDVELGPVESFLASETGEKTEISHYYYYYVRYWMGFRCFIRVLLCFFDYFHIRRYLSMALFTLFLCVIFSVNENAGKKQAFFLATSFFLVRPNIICESLQFSSCFFIAFSAMLMVPWIFKHKNYETTFFLIIGMLTMYFDFYTVPIITLGLPLLYLNLLIKREQNQRKQLLKIIKDSSVWLFGYVFMWIAKLTLTTIFTEINGFENGFNSFASRIGIHKQQDVLYAYDVKLALKKVYEIFISSDLEKRIAGIIIIIVLISLLLIERKQKYDFGRWSQNAGIIIIGLFPIIWFSFASQPTVIHNWFQYRGIIVSFWAVGLIITSGFTNLTTNHIIKGSE